MIKEIQFLKQDINMRRVKIGADVEFSFVERDCYGRIKHKIHCDAINVYRAIREGFVDSLGYDHGGRIGELRPKASEDINQVNRDIRRLIYRLSRLQNNVNACAIAGGGVNESTGGHIHFGDGEIRRISEANRIKMFDIMDDFLYYPIKERMIGGIRSSGACCNMGDQEDYYDWYKKRYNGEEVDTSISSYDIPSSYREQGHGLEYRSLPSFIFCAGFSRLVLKIAQAIAERAVEAINEGGKIVYNIPLTSRDYEKYLTRGETREFYRYLDKDNDMLTPIFPGWLKKGRVYDSEKSGDLVLSEEVGIPKEKVFYLNKFTGGRRVIIDILDKAAWAYMFMSKTLLFPVVVDSNTVRYGERYFQINFASPLYKRQGGGDGDLLYIGLLSGLPMSVVDLVRILRVFNGQRPKRSFLASIGSAISYDYKYRLRREQKRVGEIMREDIEKVNVKLIRDSMGYQQISWSVPGDIKISMLFDYSNYDTVKEGIGRLCAV